MCDSVKNDQVQRLKYKSRDRKSIEQLTNTAARCLFSLIAVFSYKPPFCLHIIFPFPHCSCLHLCVDADCLKRIVGNYLSRKNSKCCYTNKSYDCCHIFILLSFSFSFCYFLIIPGSLLTGNLIICMYIRQPMQRG